MSSVLKAAELTIEQKRALAARLLRERTESRRSALSLVHGMFEEQAARTPEAIAVEAAGRSATYRALNSRANRLARRLQALGVGPEVLVGLCVERSVEMVVGLLGILKAGGAYVPLDPAHPIQRLEYMLEDSGVGVLLTEQAIREVLPCGNMEVLCLDSEWSASDEESDEDLTASVAPANLAYVIYTSGSTGRPKGVEVTHGGLSNLLQSMRTLLRMTERDSLLAVTTLSFDIAAMEIFLPLIVGARVELVDRAIAADGGRLAERLGHPDITFLQATPATWRLLLEAGWQGKPALTMLCGGEALPRTLADRLLGKGAALWNVYGPTETTIWSSACRVEAGETPISIGRPLANTRLYVLDKRLRPVPVGVSGELFIGGDGVARGYRKRPGLTAERFLPDPFDPLRGGRLYRTGDLARWRPDGTLECQGRIDHQVKIRGFRVELSEIEGALSHHPAIREAAVAAREDSTGELGLVACLVPRQGNSLPAANELRLWLRDILPEYMVPSAFVALDTLPLTPNGKVDRKALPDPGPARRAETDDFTPPRGPIEEAVAGIWAELLGSDRVGTGDNFFEMGGHSLMAMRLLARIRDTFEVEVPLKEFIDKATVAHMARLVEYALANGAVQQMPPLLRVDRDRPLPASFAQQRLWFLHQLNPSDSSYNIPVALKLKGSFDLPALEWALGEVVRRHEVLRTIFSSDYGIPRQVIAPHLELHLTTEDLGHVPDDEREAEALRWAREEAARPFDLARGPLIRAVLLRLSTQEQVILVTVHHIVFDGWSMGILVREVSALYEAFRAGNPSPLPELAIQYADFAAWQRESLQGDTLQRQIDFWRERLAGLPDLQLPTDRPRTPVASQHGGTQSTTLPKATLDAVRALGRQETATLYMTLLAAFQVLIHRISGQEDFAVGSPIAGRPRPELENLIGFFVNTLVMRADLSGSPSFRQLLHRVRQEAIDAYTHQDLPFERMVSIAHSDREMSRSPLFQVMFALQDAPLPALRFPELELAPLNLPSESSKFDLTLFAEEVSGGLRLTMEYSTALFEATTVQRMLDRYELLLGEIIAHPDEPICTLQVLTNEEQRLLLEEWNCEGIDLSTGLAVAEYHDFDLLPDDSAALEVASDE